MQLPPTIVVDNSDDSSVESDSKHVSSIDDEVGSKQSSSASYARGRPVAARPQDLLGGKETRRLWMLKIAFGCILLGFAIGVSLWVYSAASENQEETFAREFDDRADKILDSFKSNFKKEMQSIDSLGIQATSIGRASEWPLVTLPDFDLRGASVRELSNDATLILATCPLVTAEKRPDWEAYVAQNQWWIRDSLDRQGDLQGVRRLQETAVAPEAPERLVVPFIWNLDETGTNIESETAPGPYFPIWQTYPLLQTSTNFNIYPNPDLKSSFDQVIETKQALLSDLFNASDPTNILYGIVATLQASYDNLDYKGEPVSIIYYPLFDTFTSSRELVGIVIQVIYWPVFFAGILPDSEDGYILILENQCDQQHTFEINGPEVQYLGPEDLHSSRYDSKERLFDFATEELVGSDTASLSNITFLDEPCAYSLRLYPSQTVEDRYITSQPVQLAIFGALVFVVTAFLFLLYDCLVERRQNIIMKNAMASSAIVSSIFPEVVRDRLYQSTTGKKRGGNMTGVKETQGIGEDMDSSTTKVHPKRLLKSMMLNNPLEPPAGGVSGLLSTSTENFDLAKPIADLFTHCTVMFADIAGFTAWSSQREPEQVFLLLQNVYQSFDRIARKRGVFKVETIGDCYVAVTGLPDPQKDHAIRMTKFAREAMEMMGKVTSGLEVILGPDTGELSMRFGLHSGPVIAGVLRGEKSRFQLFGDTVNTAARMESNGERNRIHISQSTANLLMASGKSNWIDKRHDLVYAKGIGEVQTYWALGQSSGKNSVGHSSNEDEKMESLATPTPVLDEIARKKQDRMIEWHVDILAQYLKRIVAHRGNTEEVPAPPQLQPTPSTGILDEVSEVIVLPRFEGNHTPEKDPGHIQLSPEIVSQLRDYIRSIGSMYRGNPFHSFEHASHVTLSATKLLNRIVIPEDVDLSDAADVHNYTYGITSDPLTQFAVILSALIHDVDHTGVPNGQLANENPEMASMYRNKSLAEQNSVDVAWNLLMDPMYADLQKCIYSEESELRRFRQLIVNSVMATDIFDPDGKKLRELRWNKAFSEDPGENATNLKATIVIEHIIQAADVAHTMQHWHIYQKWNKRLFDELYTAYLAGRAEKDPSIGWYKGEIWFFDNYVIPLAKKLHECNVFGVASDECLNSAIDNRKEWEKKGEQIVQEMVKKNRKP